tara:strand:- start:957 stop:1145 length:189 start_codon:yes stop_codon:yes gene_type:complete
MEINDLPTLFQIATAQESNARQLETLGKVIEFQQGEIEKIKKILDVQQDLLDEITHYIKAKT